MKVHGMNLFIFFFPVGVCIDGILAEIRDQQLCL